MTISNKGSASNPVLRISDGWVADTIAPALIHYRFAGYDSISQAHQNVDVLEVDLTPQVMIYSLFTKSMGIPYLL